MFIFFNYQVVCYRNYFHSKINFDFLSRPHYMKEYIWRICEDFIKLLTHLSLFVYSLCISSKNMWRTCEEYVTVYCLKFYIILNKLKSVWIYPKLWRILNNRMTLNAIEIWNLNRFKGTYRAFYGYIWWKKARWIHKVIITK